MRKLISLVALMLTLSIFGQQKHIEIKPNEIVDKEIIKNQLLEYKIEANDILSKDSTNANAYRVAGLINLIQFRFKDCSNNIHRAIFIDSTNNNLLSLSENYNILAHYYKDLQKNDSSFFYFKKAVELARNNSNKYTGRHLHDLYSIYNIRGQKDSATVVIKDAFEYTIKAKDSFNLLMLKERENNLLNKGKHDLESAISLLDFGQRKSNWHIKAMAQGMLGKYYQNSRDSLNYAVKYLDSALIFFEKSQNLFMLNTTYPSRAYVAKKDSISTIKALEYYERQYETVKNTGHIYEAMTMVNLATEYQKNGKVKDAERIYKSIVNLSKKKELQKILLAITHENLSKIYENNGNYKEALKEYKLLYKNETEAYSTQIADQATKYKIQYETEKKEKELAEQKIANQEQELLTQKANTRNWLLALGVLMAIVLTYFIWKKYKSEAKAKETINEQKTLVETLQKELHHRMKNNLSFIDLFINLAKGRFEDEAYQSKLNELQNRMRSMFEAHRQLFKKEDVTSVKAKSYIDTLVSNVQEAYAKGNISIFNRTDPNETILADTSFPVGLIINEFVTNSYKYAFDDHETGVIDIAIKSENEVYNLLLKDNGKGLPKDLDIDNLDSFGIETIQLLTKEYGGTISIDGSNGVVMNITLPKTDA